MKLNILFLCFAIYAFSFIANCSPLVSDVSGEVFIVTKGGQSIKLGLVEIQLFKENAIKSDIKGKIEIAKSKISPLQPGFNDLKNEVDKLTIDYYAEKKIMDSWKGIDNDKMRESFYRWTPISRNLMLKQEEYQKIYDKVSMFFGVRYYVYDFPEPVSTTKTDADGKFTINLKPGKYALLAMASRLVGGETEKYAWLIWITVKSNRNKITLSNDNLFETSSKENVVNLNELTK